MPNRIIKESINESRGLAGCSFFAQDLYKRLITYADDYGRFNADPQIMVARLYPRDLAVVSLEDLTEGLIELAGVKKIGFYTASPRHEIYGAFPNWGEHQRLRDSKRNYPEPDDTSVNDWYLRRYVPIEMRIEIIERDKFRCKICGKHIAETENARFLVKMGAGLYHIDHIVPCQQGGRTTMENLRLTCPNCNLSRKRLFSYDEVLKFAASCGELRQDAASCGELRLIRAGAESESESELNPIRKENVCSEPSEKAPEPPSEPALYWLDLNDGSKFGVTQSMIDKYQELYPAVDIHQQIRNMVGWCDSNPSKRKTRGGIKRFINSWLQKEQDRGGNHGGNKPANQFVSFSQLAGGGV